MKLQQQYLLHIYYIIYALHHIRRADAEKPRHSYHFLTAKTRLTYFDHYKIRRDFTPLSAEADMPSLSYQHGRRTGAIATMCYRTKRTAPRRKASMISAGQYQRASAVLRPMPKCASSPPIVRKPAFTLHALAIAAQA